MKIKNEQLKKISKIMNSFHKWRKLNISTDEETSLRLIKEVLK